MQAATNYNPEIFEYLRLNGFQEFSKDDSTGCITYKNLHKAVILWSDRIEYRVYVGHSWLLQNSYKGFNQKNIIHFILLMQIMGAIKISNMIKASGQMANVINEVVTVLERVNA